MNKTWLCEDFSLSKDAFRVYCEMNEFCEEKENYDQWIERLKSSKKILFIVSYVNEEPVGFLIGYERFSSFYIWLAGVLVDFRRQKIFSDLFERCERWSIEKNYKSLFVKTRNCFKSMLIFLIKNDFKLFDVDKRDSIETHRLILTKSLG